MRISRISCAALPILCLPIVSLTPPAPSSDQDQTVGTGRIFPLLPPFQNVDFAANFNKLRSPGDTVYFVVRDTIVYFGLSVMWIGIHTLIWDGEVSSVDDVMSSLLTPGFSGSLSKAENLATTSLSSLERISSTFPAEVSLVNLWNFFANPNPATRNLYLNIGFASCQFLLWIIPTYFGTLPEPDAKIAEEKIIGLPEHLGQSDPVKLWNRLLCPQCIAQIIGINTLLWSGKMLFWTIMSNLPNLPAETVVTGRKKDDISPSQLFFEAFIDNVKQHVSLVISDLETNLR